jgi:hypothetical protein
MIPGSSNFELGINLTGGIKESLTDSIILSPFLYTSTTYTTNNLRISYLTLYSDVYVYVGDSDLFSPFCAINVKFQETPYCLMC